MNSKDRKNLDFLKTLNNDRDWSDFRNYLVSTMGVDEAIKELQYAVSLLQVDDLEAFDAIDDVTEANILLEKFKL